MKKAIFLLFMFSCVYSFSQKETGDLKTVSNNMAAQVLAWNNADIRGFMTYYWQSDSLLFIGSKGITLGWEKTLNNYKRNYPNKTAVGVLTFLIKENIQLSPTIIYTIGQWSLEKEKPSGGYFTLLW
ncbi:MAG: DUF4440 domain-containing protein, partial [Bacteroidota bacterium]